MANEERNDTMSTNHKIYSQGDFELYIDEHSNRYDISINRSSKSTGDSSCSIELNDLTVDELKDVCVRMVEVLSYYHMDYGKFIDELIERVPEYKNVVRNWGI